MKITRKQLRKIIKEQMDQSKDLEGFYALLYTQRYLVQYTLKTRGYQPDTSAIDSPGGAKDIASKNRGARKLEESLGSLTEALGKSVGNAMNDIGLASPERVSIKKEAEAAASDDYREDVYKGIEEIDRMINDQTPIGMSAVEAINYFSSTMRQNREGYDSQSVITATQQLIALMDDNDVLGFLDTWAQA